VETANTTYLNGVELATYTLGNEDYVSLYGRLTAMDIHDYNIQAASAIAAATKNRYRNTYTVSAKTKSIPTIAQIQIPTIRSYTDYPIINNDNTSPFPITFDTVDSNPNIGAFS
jgi:hypothetical protein